MMMKSELLIHFCGIVIDILQIVSAWCINDFLSALKFSFLDLHIKPEPYVHPNDMNISCFTYFVD